MSSIKKAHAVLLEKSSPLFPHRDELVSFIEKLVLPLGVTVITREDWSEEYQHYLIVGVVLRKEGVAPS
jgi:hypothetical protein